MVHRMAAEHVFVLVDRGIAMITRVHLVARFRLLAAAPTKHSTAHQQALLWGYLEYGPVGAMIQTIMDI